MLKGKNIVLGVSGGIAAYKIANLASKLVKNHANVHVIMTENATNFINPITFETLTGNRCIGMLMDSAPVLRNWLAECRSAQRKDGLVENIAPVNNAGSFISKMLQGSAGWGDACVLVPWAVYEATGDLSVLRENYGMMIRWLRFVERRARRTRFRNRRNPEKKLLVDRGFHFGEWIEPDVPNLETMKKNLREGAPEVATAYYSLTARLVSRAASLLGLDEEAHRYAETAERAKTAYRFTCTEGGHISSTRQAAYVRPIAFGLLEGDEAQEAADRLAALVKKSGYRLNTGFLSTPHLCRVLAEYVHTAKCAIPARQICSSMRNRGNNRSGCANRPSFS